MEIHRIKVRFIFDGWFDIEAENQEHACSIVKRDCGLVMGGNIHTSNKAQVVEWEFSTHPEKEIIN